jgi:hypothetical protein
MDKWLILLFPLGWFAICSLIYRYLVRWWVRTESFGAHMVLGLLSAFFLAPGFIVAHGVAPFPAGAACLVSFVQRGIAWEGMVNLACWLVTAAVFAALGWWSVRRANAEQARIDALWNDITPDMADLRE